MYELGKAELPVQPTTSYFDFVHAATIDARNLYGAPTLSGESKQNLAVQNAEWLMKKAGGDGYKGWSRYMRMTFTKITKEYFPDLIYTLHSPIDAGSLEDPNRGGVNLSAAQWQSFVKLPMEDNKALVLVGTVFQGNINQLRIATSSAEQLVVCRF